MLTSANLGDRLQFESREWWVVRIVQSSSLHHNAEGWYKLEEHYLELRNTDGEISFYSLASEKKPIDTAGLVLGLPDLPWKKENTNV